MFRAQTATLLTVSLVLQLAAGDTLIIDHRCTDITQIPTEAIVRAKQRLHIAYAHTSHGSQLVSGMSELVGFSNNGGKGMSHPVDLFAVNSGGVGGALDLHNYAMDGDLGYYPQWYDETRLYLNNPAHADVNVVMWSWCSQVPEKYAEDRLITEYLEPMGRLETLYPHVTFVYMTGHVEHGRDAHTKAGNQIIRDYCEANGKVLYDFADIESHDPDGTYYPFPDANCDYYASLNGERLGNWAQQWQDSHVEGVDWYVCDSAHSEPLNANQKAYAAWWMFARLAGWPGPATDPNTSRP